MFGTVWWDNIEQEKQQVVIVGHVDSRTRDSLVRILISI